MRHQNLQFELIPQLHANVSLTLLRKCNT
ncbi:hypothetical protein MPLDJ20_150495 [Mesorhizobium plurifarium]|uniref:Uncharacterized protein n=1 Tax=Mesorhizobium plurifarium TaxID=69974 RepID=A0A090EPX5_MESPL|nr:hypothetical protein MPLDJ20_150495 [Mesorhizobium plurifarium]